jgi:ribonuclease Z
MLRHVIAVCALLLSAVQAYAESDFRVTLLGTATPAPRANRFGPSTLVEAGGQVLLFDAGRGVPIRMGQLKVPVGKISALFITHYHSDHVVGIPDVWLTGWLGPVFGRRATPFHVIGPTGAKNLMTNLEKAYALDIGIREVDEKLPPQGIAVQADEFDKDGVVYEKDGVKVTAFEVDHGPAIKPAYGYRIDYKGRAVVISGDTRYDENLIKAAKGADLVIHEVALASAALLASSEQFRRIVGHHTTPEEAGTVFAKVNPKLAVYTHLVMLSAPGIPEESLASLIDRTRTTYQGPLVIGEDLMSFVVDDKVSIFRAAR